MKKAVFALLIPALLATVVVAADGDYTRWKLDFEYSKPANIVMQDALGNAHVCWYMTYTVTNSTDRDIPLRLAIRAETDTDKTYRDSIAPLSQKKLEKRTGKKFKNALDMSKGTIPAGETIQAVAFFGNIDPNWDRLTIHTAGLYESIDQVDGKLYYENKVNVTSWYRPGDEYGSVNDVITFKGEKWVVEGDRVEIPQQKPE